MHFRLFARDFRIDGIASIIFSAAMAKQQPKKERQPGARVTLGTNRFALPCILIAAVIAVVFFPSLKNGFTNWDDDTKVTNNPDIQKVTLHNIVKVFSSSYASTYQPVTMLAYMTQFAAGGPDPAVFHATSLFIHIVNCLLVFALLYGLSGSFFTGFIAALIFAVHPLRIVGCLFFVITLLPVLQIVPIGSAIGARGETDNAIEDFTSALRYDPKFAKAYDNRGIAYISNGMADQAFADFSKAMELDPDYYDAYNNRGILYGFHNEFDKAIADFSQAIALKSDYERAYLNRGIAYMQIRNFPRALKDFDKALELNPGDAAAMEKRNQALTSLQKVK